MIPDNACHFRITAAAGTELAVTSYLEYRHLEYLLDIQGIVLFDRGLQPEGLQSPKWCRWIRLSSIVQFSSLLPPVGAWAVSQSQRGRSPSQAGYLSKPW